MNLFPKTPSASSGSSTLTPSSQPFVLNSLDTRTAAASSGIRCHVTCGYRKAAIWTTKKTLIDDIVKHFNLKNEAKKGMILQIFEPKWDDYVDVTSAAIIKNKCKLRVILPAVQQCGVTTSPIRYPTSNALMDAVKKLLNDYPDLKGEDYEMAKKFWGRYFHQQFRNCQSEITKKAEKATQSTTESKLLDKLSVKFLGKEIRQRPLAEKAVQADITMVYQDMSPIMLSMKQELNKSEPDYEKIKCFMCVTFQYRRSFITNSLPRVMAVVELYPALFNCDGVRQEFHRITGKNCTELFQNNIKKYSRIIYNLSKTSSFHNAVEASLKAANKEKKSYNWSTAALLLLPSLLKEDLNFIWFKKQEFNTKQTNPFIQSSGDVKEVLAGSAHFKIYCEGVLIAETDEFINAVECFLASFVLFLIEYRVDARQTSQLLQSFFIEYDDPTEELEPSVIMMAERLKSELIRQKPYLKH